MDKRPQIPALTGLRFFAALWVVLFHYAAIGLIAYPPVVEQIAIHGRAGVDLFFVLSGFVLAYNYAAWFGDGLGHYWRFVQARAARIYPMYVVALVVAIPVGLARFPDAPAGPLAIVWMANLLLVQVYVPISAMHVWNRPGWSLAAEAFFYVLFPFFAYHVLRRFSRPAALLALAVALYVVEVAAFLAAADAARKVSLGFDHLEMTVYFPPWLRVWEFFIGCALGALFLHTRGPLQARHWRDRSVAVALIGSGIVMAVPESGGVYVTWQALASWYVTFTPFFALLIFALASGDTFLSGVLSRPLIVLLGEASYSLYLLHRHALAALALVVPDAGALLLVPVLAALIGVSVLCYRMIETPARRWLRPTHPTITAKECARVDGSMSTIRPTV